MKSFLTYSRREIGILRRRAAAMEDAGKEAESLELLCLVEEIETAVNLVRQSITAAKKLREMGSLQ